MIIKNDNKQILKDFKKTLFGLTDQTILTVQTVLNNTKILKDLKNMSSEYNFQYLNNICERYSQ